VKVDSEDGSGNARREADPGLRSLERVPGGWGTAEFRFQQKQTSLLEHEIELKPVRGRKTGGQAKSLLRESSFAPGCGPTNDHHPFHVGEKA